MGQRVKLDRRPRVLLLSNIPAPYRLPVFEALGEHVDLTVYLCQGQDPDRLWQVELCSECVHYELLPERILHLPGSTKVIWNPGLWGRLQHTLFDVYIAGENFSTFPAVLSMLRAARRRNRLFILWSEAIDTSYSSGHPLSNAYRRWLYRQTDAFIAYGQRAKTYLERRGAPSDRITIGFQVVPPEQLPAPIADKTDLGLSGKTVVLYVGYFVARKGLHHLIQAFQAVAGENDVLALVGSGPQEKHLREVVHGDERIIFPGYLEGAGKTSWYAAADLFVLPTLHDPWGLVINEAMAFGLPIIVTDAAGCTDLVQDSGLVVPAGNTDALATALARLLTDEALRYALGQRSRRIISAYTVRAACDAFLQVIDDARRKQ
jgi:glycosyltransferase involved in cell wall biosynthesis